MKKSIVVIVLSIILLCGCMAAPNAAAPVDTTSAITGAVSSAPAETPIVSQSASPSPENSAMTPEVSPSSSQSTEVSPSPGSSATESVDQEAAIIAQQKEDFLNRTGDYTYDKIKDELFIFGVGHKTYKLGVVDYYNGKAVDGQGNTVDIHSTEIQGWLFNYRDEGGNLILEVGFDGKGGKKRFIKEVIVPVSFYQQYANYSIGLGFWSSELWQELNSSNTFLGMKGDMAAIEDLLKPFINKPMLFQFATKYMTNPQAEEKFGEGAKALEKLHGDNAPAVNVLLSEVENNGEKVKVGNTKNAASCSLIPESVRACFN